MKTLFLALALIAASAASSAADNANPDQLAAIRGGLVTLHNDLMALLAAQKDASALPMATHSNYLEQVKKQGEALGVVCQYEDKIYTEGAVRQVGNISLVCVEKPYGIKMDNKPNLVWEPVTSKRLDSYRRITGLDASK